MKCSEYLLVRRTASFGFAPIYLGGLVVGGRMQQAGGPLAGRDLVDFGYH